MLEEVAALMSLNTDGRKKVGLGMEEGTAAVERSVDSRGTPASTASSAIWTSGRLYAMIDTWPLTLSFDLVWSGFGHGVGRLLGGVRTE